MFVYENNKQVKAEFKKVVIDQNTTMTAIAEKCGMIPQQLNNRFRNDRLYLISNYGVMQWAVIWL